MSPAVRVRLEDMLTYAEGATAMVDRHGREGVLSEWGLRQGLIKALEVVGEAASRIPETDRPRLGDLPWEQVIGLRHHLVHGYSAVRMDVLFDVVERRLPPLIAEIERVLQETPE